MANRLWCNSVYVDDREKMVMGRRGWVALTCLEWKALAALAAIRGQTMTIERLKAEVWGVSHGITNRRVRTMIWRLRKKVGNNKVNCRHGVGYSLGDYAPIGRERIFT